MKKVLVLLQSPTGSPGHLADQPAGHDCRREILQSPTGSPGHLDAVRTATLALDIDLLQSPTGSTGHLD